MIDAARDKHLRRYRRWMSLVLGVFVLIAGYYSVVVPAFEAPDEIWHFAIVQHLATGHGLPVTSPNTEALWGWEGTQAPGYYLAAAALTWWVDQSDFPALYERINPHASLGNADATANRNFFVHHRDEAWPWRGSILALHVTRFFSVLLGAITVWAIYRMLELLVAPELALVGAAMVAFIPQFLFISSAANNDNSVNALSALVLWRLVALMTTARRPSLANGRSLAHFRCSFVTLGCLLGLALLTKLSASGLLALTGLALLFVALQNRSWRLFFEGTVLVGVPVLLVGGWWFARNWILYQDPLAWNMWRANALLRVIPSSLRTVGAELEGLERSFWGVFGWMNVSYPSWVYTGFRALEAILVIGVAAGVASLLRRKVALSPRFWSALLALLWLGLLTASWLRLHREVPSAQGRYFQPALAALALLVAFSARSWYPRVALLPLYWGVVAGLVVLSVSTPAWLIRPAYTVPPSKSVAMSELVPLQADLGRNFQITGLAAGQQTLRPGQTATLTVAWRGLAPTSTDYSVFVHLVDDLGLIVGQTDTMPGNGLLPTSQWTPGQTRIEDYAITIPSTAYAPIRGRWLVGLYDHRTGQRLPVTMVNPIPGSPGLPGGVVSASDGIVFGSVELVERPGAVPNPLSLDFEDNLRLAGYSFSSRELHPTDPLTVTLYWQPRGPVGRSYTVFVHLLDGAFDTHGGEDGKPPADTTTWRPGDTVVTTLSFEVAEGAVPGFYQVEVGLYPPPGFDRLPLLSVNDAVGADRVLLGPLLVSP